MVENLVDSEFLVGFLSLILSVVGMVGMLLLWRTSVPIFFVSSLLYSFFIRIIETIVRWKIWDEPPMWDEHAYVALGIICWATGLSFLRIMATRSVSLLFLESLLKDPNRSCENERVIFEQRIADRLEEARGAGCFAPENKTDQQKLEDEYLTLTPRGKIIHWISKIVLLWQPRIRSSSKES